MDNKISYQQLWQSLTPLYDEGEAKAVVRMLLEEAFGLTFTDICCGKVEELSADDRQRLEALMARLRQGEPVQYVLGGACFCGRRFGVAPGVLIPRPETEDLCRTVKSYHNTPFCALQPPAPLQVLDVGTGSGCIAVTLALDLFNAEVTAWDVSGDALVIARCNAHRLGRRSTSSGTTSSTRRPTTGGGTSSCRTRPTSPARTCRHEPPCARPRARAGPLCARRRPAACLPRHRQLCRAHAQRRRMALSRNQPPLRRGAARDAHAAGLRQVLLQKDRFGKVRFLQGQCIIQDTTQMMTEEKALSALAALCARGEHCTGEMNDKMVRWGLDEEARRRIIEYLVGHQYVDDERYCRAFVNDKVKYDRWGRRKIEQALWAKHIAPEGVGIGARRRGRRRLPRRPAPPAQGQMAHHQGGERL
jgi:hypothetical protein